MNIFKEEMLCGKNLLDIDKEIQTTINYFNNQKEVVTSVELNQKTYDMLNAKKLKVSTHCIRLIINNDLHNNEIKVNREKMAEITEYQPYEIKVVK